MAGLGTTELIIILALALILFGPKNLPKLGSAIGKTAKNFREGMESAEKSEDSVSEIVVEDGVEYLDHDSHDDIFCNKCGAKNPASASFCSKCGSKLSH